MSWVKGEYPALYEVTCNGNQMRLACTLCGHIDRELKISVLSQRLVSSTVWGILQGNQMWLACTLCGHINRGLNISVLSQRWVSCTLWGHMQWESNAISLHPVWSHRPGAKDQCPEPKVSIQHCMGYFTRESNVVSLHPALSHRPGARYKCCDRG